MTPYATTLLALAGGIAIGALSAHVTPVQFVWSAGLAAVVAVFWEGRSLKSRGTVVIVTGSRGWTDSEPIIARLKRYPAGTILIHGDARGADTIAANAGRVLCFQVIAHPYFGDIGKAGGPLRNGLMVSLGCCYVEFGYDVFVEAFPLPRSSGTRDLIRQARRALLTVTVTEGAGA